jgi:23S rRNA (cytosine1962-C5)-methyltransferase
VINGVKQEVLCNLKQITQEFKRLFHGRGGCFKGFEFLTIDAIDTVLFVVYFSKISDELDGLLKDFFKTLHAQYGFKTVVLQKREGMKIQQEVLFKELQLQHYAIENELKYHIYLNEYQNIGFFGDMKNGRAFVAKHCYNKNVLNLFSYTCSFSVVALKNGVKQVVNVDMSKRALSIGRQNHIINGLDTKKVKFLPYNILKSWSKIKKFALYDLIIIDPPSFQKGSFVASSDYVKIIKKLDALGASNCMVLACLNDPFLSAYDLISWFKEHAKTFEFKTVLENLETFKSLDVKKSLKCVVFER